LLTKLTDWLEKGIHHTAPSCPKVSVKNKYPQTLCRKQQNHFSKCVIGWRPPKWLQGTIGRYKKNSTKILQKMYACCETFLECVCEYIWYVRKTEPVIIIILLGTYYLIRDCEAQNVFRHNFGKQHITQNNGQKKFQVFLSDFAYNLYYTT